MFDVLKFSLISIKTAEIQPSYAPDVKIAGVALGGLAPNATHITGIASNTLPHGVELTRLLANPSLGYGHFTAMSFLGLSHDYANLSRWLDDNLVPENAAEFRKAEQQCFNANYMFQEQPISRYLKRGQQSLLDPVPLSVMTNAGTFSSALEHL